MPDALELPVTIPDELGPAAHRLVDDAQEQRAYRRPHAAGVVPILPPASEAATLLLACSRCEPGLGRARITVGPDGEPTNDDVPHVRGISAADASFSASSTFGATTSIRSVGSGFVTYWLGRFAQVAVAEA